MLFLVLLHKNIYFDRLLQVMNKEVVKPLDLIDIYYPEDNELREILLIHSRLVAEKALSIAELHPELNLDKEFLYEAAMLHDIGIFKTNAPGIHCMGDAPYISHGYLGADLVREAGFERHALVCERHTGTGLSLDDIVLQNLPLPHRDMMPISLEEQVICFADKFFSKSHIEKEKTVEEVKKSLIKHGITGEQRFNMCCEQFLSP